MFESSCHFARNRLGNLALKIKVKFDVKLPLPTPLRDTGSVELHLHSFMTLALDGGEWLASSLGRFTFEKIAPASH
jgi:hypothetical protein